MSVFGSKRKKQRSKSTLAPPITELRRSSSNPESHPSARRARHSLPVITNYQYPSNQQYDSFYTHLLRIALNPRTKSPSSLRQLRSMTHSQLIVQWDISRHLDTTYYRLKSSSLTILRTLIVFDDFSDVLIFSFSNFLDLSHRPSPSQSHAASKFQWVYHCYRLLIDSLSLKQRALLLSKCVSSKQRKYAMIHYGRDFVVGKQAVDFMVQFQIAMTRKSAVHLGQRMIQNGYLRHCTGSKVGNKYKFRDSHNSQYILDVDDSEPNRIHIICDDDDDESDGERFGLCSSDEDNDFLFRDIVNIQDHTTRKRRAHSIQKLDRLGSNHDLIIKQLLSFYAETPFELRALVHDKLRGLIRAPNPSLTLSSTLLADPQSDGNDDNEEIDDKDHYNKFLDEMPDLVLGASINERSGGDLKGKYVLTVESTEYHLNIIYNLNANQREKLLSVQGTAFDSYAEAIHFVLNELWEIYNEIAFTVYNALIHELSVIEKAKILSVGVDRKPRFRNLTKYRDCFVGHEAVVFMLKSRLVDTRMGAVALGNLFCKKKWIKHVKNERVFEDQDLFYVVMDDEIDRGLKELYIYRQQQVSNHVKLSLDIVTPSKEALLQSKRSEAVHFYDDGDGHDSDEILIDYRHSSMDIPAVGHYAKYSKSDSLESAETYFQ